MATSYNGWSVIKSGLWPLPAVTGSVRAGAVWVVFHWLAKEYAARVEKITRAHSWGYAYRQVRGGKSWSNHASGTAADFNAPAHPMGKRGTMTAKQVAACRAIEKESGGILNWGDNIPDEMHWEIGRGVSAARVERFAAQLLQKALNRHGAKLKVDGVRGPDTVAATKAFQQARGLDVDGIDGPKTWAALDKTPSTPTPEPEPEPDPTPTPKPPSFTAMFWNILGARFSSTESWAGRRDQVVATMRSAGASLIGICEAYGDEGAWLLKKLGGGWLRFYTPFGVQLLFNRKVWLHTNDRQWERRWDSAHGFQVVELKHRPTGRMVNVLTLHTAPPATATSADRKRQWQAAATFVQGWKDPTLVLGDFNDEQAGAWLTASGFTAPPLSVPTIGTKRYDWAAARKTSRIEVVVGRHGGASDHHPLTVPVAL